MPDSKNVNKIEGDNNYTFQGVENSHFNFYGSKDAKLPKELTLNLPKTDPDKIVGRADDLEELHQLLVKDKRVVLMNGLGGIGKTTLAQVYVSKYYEEYQHIAWISQSSENIANDFLNETGLIRYLDIETANPEPEKIFEEIILKLKAIEEKPNLLIIDNGEHSLQKYLKKLPGQPAWHLLVTSREKIEGFHHKHLGFLNAKEATELFKKHYTRKRIIDQNIKDLIATVDYHTLTIELLAKTAQNQSYDAVTLMQAIEKNLKANVEVFHNKEFGRIEKVGSYLSTVFSLSKLSENGIWLLKQFACLPSEFHSYDLLSELLLDEESTHKDVFAETLTDTSRRGWLLHNTEEDSYKMHSIISKVVKREQPISVEDIKPLIIALTQKLSIDQDKDNPIDKFVWITFGKTILTDFNEDGSYEITGLQNTLALVLKELGDYQGSKDLLEKALQSDEKNYGTGHPNTAVIYSNLALVLRDLGDYQRAKVLLEKVVLSDEKNYGTEHPTTAKRYSKLAMVLSDLGDYSEAKDLLEKATLSIEKNYITEHSSIAAIYSNLATTLQHLGDYVGAKDLLEKAVLLDEKNYGTEHPYTAISYSNLAMVLKDLGDYQGAKALLEKAKRSDEKNYGTQHSSTAIRYSNLAMVLKDLEDYQGAKVLLEKAVLSDEKNYGTGNPSTAISYLNLATLLQDLGEYNEAITFSEKALLIFKNVLPEGHPYINTASDLYQSIRKIQHIDI